MNTIAAGFIILIFALFLLSLIAPAGSNHPFWKLIHIFRSVMDAVSYWFLTGCLFLAVATGIVCIISKLLP